MLEITPKDKEFVLKNLEFIKSREWYEENQNIQDSIKSINGARSDNDELISINKQLIGLYKMDKKYQKELKVAIKDVEDRESFNRDTMASILKKFDKELLIVDAVNQILGE